VTSVASAQAHEPRLIFASLLTLAAVALLCVFYGMPENAMVFFVAILCILLAVSALGARRLANGIARRPTSSFLALAALLLLGVNYQFSLSKDSGFAATWTLALLPLTFLMVRELEHWRWRLHSAISALVLGFAGISLWNYAAHGDRPTLPLTDPNNYCTLLYLVLLPGCYGYLHRVWSGAPLRWYWHAAAHVAAALIVAVVFASESRAGAVIVGVGLAVFLGIGVSRRLRLLPVVSLLCVTALLYVGVAELHAGASRFNAAEIGEGVEVRGALNGAALDIYRQHPAMGAGINLFPVLYRIARDPLDQETAGLSPHNDYLQILAEGGPLMLLLLLAFAVAVGQKFLRVCFTERRNVPDLWFGALLALGAALAHAAINFVLLTPVLACVLGISAAIVPWHSRGVGNLHRLGGIRGAVYACMVWGWLSLAYLGLDTFSHGVFGNQAGIPYAGYVREDPQRRLAYSKFVQTVNADRGTPVLAEAQHYQSRLAGNPTSTYLQNLTLSVYRRALLVDPWNPYGLLQMYDFIQANPRLQSALEEGERPADLLLRSIYLDPILLPAYDRIIQRFSAQGRDELAYALVKERLAPWLIWLVRENPDGATKVLEYLQKWSVKQRDGDLQAELEAASTRLVSQPSRPLQLWFR